MTVHITNADPVGMPVEAICWECGEWWVRPAGDPAAATLEFFAFTHRHPAPDHPKRRAA
jgi:hypothetical protein